jgi:hypothetical protein
MQVSETAAAETFQKVAKRRDAVDPEIFNPSVSMDVNQFMTKVLSTDRSHTDPVLNVTSTISVFIVRKV